MNRFAACVEYDGSNYCGWQRQDHSPSVQESVEKALSFVANEPIGVVCAGRTDTGVHGIGQIIHWDTQAERSERSWVLGANTKLPDDVVLHWVRPIEEGFHARFSARSRRYRYVIHNRWVRPALMRGRVTWTHYPLDSGRMHEAALLLKGEHDFSTFRALGCQAKSPVRTIEDISVTRDGEYIYLDVQANAFLHHMVRNIAGVLMTIGKGDQPVEWVSALLALKDRSQGGVTAPPDGLYFMRVFYDEQWALPDTPDFAVFRGANG